MTAPIKQKLAAGGLLAAALVASGCGASGDAPPIQVWDDMKQQEKYKPQSASAIFGDGRSNRLPVSGTVAVGYAKLDNVLYTGIQRGMYVGRNPMPVDTELLAWGQQRFNTYCSPCHDRTGGGAGMVGRGSLWIAQNLAEERVVAMPDGELFDIISNGRRSMPAYRTQLIHVRDRWAIVAYLRALQLSATGKVSDVPAELVGDLR